MKVSAKDSAYFKKTKDYIVPKALELLSEWYGVNGEWNNDKLVMLEYEPQSSNVYKFMVLDTINSQLDFVFVNIDSEEVFSPKNISFIER